MLPSVRAVLGTHGAIKGVDLLAPLRQIGSELPRDKPG
jgi:hypothetical protein